MENDIDNLENFKNEIRENNIGCGFYIFACMSFIPLIGIIFGVISIVVGFITRRRKGIRLVIIGSLGILTTIIIYVSLFYFGFVQRGGIYDEMRVQMTEQQLPNVVKSIEFYKIQYGEYPESLSELLEKSNDDLLIIYDTANTNLTSVNIEFYYELSNDGEYYYLFSSGADGIAFTDDDIFPNLSEDEIKNIGYQVKE